jgi:hypothetical protein
MLEMVNNPLVSWCLAFKFDSLLSYLLDSNCSTLDDLRLVDEEVMRIVGLDAFTIRRLSRELAVLENKGFTLTEAELGQYRRRLSVEKELGVIMDEDCFDKLNRAGLTEFISLISQAGVVTCSDFMDHNDDSKRDWTELFASKRPINYLEKKRINAVILKEFTERPPPAAASGEQSREEFVSKEVYEAGLEKVRLEKETEIQQLREELAKLRSRSPRKEREIMEAREMDKTLSQDSNM